MKQRRALLHVGTHKTGTKTIQAFLADNWDRLYNAGVYVPNAGRVAMGEGQYSPGHHHLATALRTSDSSILDRLRDELSDVPAQHLLLSSEEFYPLLGEPDALRKLATFLRDLGFEPYTVVYFRAQSELAESMYAEMAKTFRPPAFADCIGEIIRFGELHHGQPYRVIFEYSRALLDLAEIFGAKSVVARAYPEASDPTKLIADFVRTVSAVLGGLDVTRLQVLTPSLNRRLSFGDVMGALDKDGLAHIGVDAKDARLLAPFSPLLRSEFVAIRERFQEDNERVAAIANARITLRDFDDAASLELAQWQRAILDRLWSRWDA